MIGKTLAHYEIVSLLGKGGMGEVYRARDGKLGREVALKILPTEFSGDPERAARFDREARTLASLQHPNVASIYGFEEVDGVRFLVMELVEGEDLAERLKHGALPVPEAIDIAHQIAEGLEDAHAQDIVHRDLKPANIKITPTRDVKILDFGLARAYAGETEANETEALNSPTITAGMTMPGMILGTAAYMSPEQARGRAVDKQSDIWSFGVVLYEMLTGDCLFRGETVSDSIGAILHRDPDLDLLPDVPPQVRTLLRRALERDKRQRLQDIGDARLELDEAKTGEAKTGNVAVESTGTGRQGRAGWIAALAMALVAAILGTMYFTRGPIRELSQTTLGVPQDQSLSLTGGSGWARVQLSPDGNSVVYVGGRPGDLYLRDIDSFETTKLADTEGAVLPVFSPDGRWVAYANNAKLWKIAVSGGAPIEICETAVGPGLAWGDGELYFSRTNGGGLWAVAENGGEPRPISTLDDARDETSHRWPHVLPGGRHLLLTIKTAHIGTFDDASIGLLTLDSGDVTVLLQGGSNPRFVPTGHLVYGRDFQLFSVPFDLKSLAVQGTPTSVLDGVHISDITGSTHYTLSPQGHLAYLPSLTDFWDFEIVWLARTGLVSSIETDQPRAFEPAMGPDGNKFAAVVAGANDKIWVYDQQQKTTSRLTSTPGNDRNPVWSPDGMRIVYMNDREGPLNLFVISVDGSAPAEKLLTSAFDDLPTSWSPDDARLLFTRIMPDGDSDIWTVNMAGDREATPFLQTANREGMARFSPDGRWVTYVSNSSGEQDVYVRPYPGPGNPVRVSRASGRRPVWSRDGTQLFYTSGNHMMAVSVDGTDSFRVGDPEELFVLGDEMLGILANMSPTMDAERFLGARFNPDAMQSQIRVVFDWAERLKELAPGR